MRRIVAIGTIGMMVLLGVAMVTWAQDGAPPAGAPGQAQHPWGGGGAHPWGGQRKFDGGPGRFGEQRMMGGQRMGWQRGGHRGFGRGLDRLADNPRVRQFLGLTDDQVARLHKIGIDSEKASVQMRADMQLRHIELRELMRADNPDREAIMQKLDQINALQGKMEKARVANLLDARAVLTPDQLKKLKAFRENRGEGGPGRGHMMERHGGMGHPPGHPGSQPGESAPKPPAQ